MAVIYRIPRELMLRNNSNTDRLLSSNCFVAKRVKPTSQLRYDAFLLTRFFSSPNSQGRTWLPGYGHGAVEDGRAPIGRIDSEAQGVMALYPEDR